MTNEYIPYGEAVQQLKGQLDGMDNWGDFETLSDVIEYLDFIRKELKDIREYYHNSAGYFDKLAALVGSHPESIGSGNVPYLVKLQNQNRGNFHRAEKWCCREIKTIERWLIFTLSIPCS